MHTYVLVAHLFFSFGVTSATKKCSSNQKRYLIFGFLRPFVDEYQQMFSIFSLHVYECGCSNKRFLYHNSFACVSHWFVFFANNIRRCWFFCFVVVFFRVFDSPAALFAFFCCSLFLFHLYRILLLYSFQRRSLLHECITRSSGPTYLWCVPETQVFTYEFTFIHTDIYTKCV